MIVPLDVKETVIKLFNESGWSAIRSAGSGSSQYPSPDILAGNSLRKLAIECKITKDKKKYFQKCEIEQLNTFSNRFGSESWIGVKFPKNEWHFIKIDDLEQTGACWAVSLDLIKEKGLVFSDLLLFSH